MTLRIGLIGTGEMGSAVGARLHERGATVVASLAGRSAASAARIAAAGIGPARDDDDVVAASAFVLSIVPPGEAVAVAERYAPALARAPGACYVDCNAVAPQTMTNVARIVARAGAACIDAGIIGGPPRGDYAPRLYASGPSAPSLLRLEALGLRIRVLEGDIGLASAFKMCYGGMTKGLTAIGSAMRAAAERDGLAAELQRECAESQPQLQAWLDRQLPLMPPKAYRWVAEMNEIAHYADDPAVTDMYAAFARYYEQIARDVALAR